ncbi:hypothetical protein [Kytococcus sp. Marseille-QA3725]
MVVSMAVLSIYGPAIAIPAVVVVLTEAIANAGDAPRPRSWVRWVGYSSALLLVCATLAMVVMGADDAGGDQPGAGLVAHLLLWPAVPTGCAAAWVWIRMARTGRLAHGGGALVLSLAVAAVIRYALDVGF